MASLLTLLMLDGRSNGNVLGPSHSESMTNLMTIPLEIQRVDGTEDFAEPHPIQIFFCQPPILYLYFQQHPFSIMNALFHLSISPTFPFFVHILPNLIRISNGNPGCWNLEDDIHLSIH